MMFVPRMQVKLPHVEVAAVSVVVEDVVVWLVCKVVGSEFDELLVPLDKAVLAIWDIAARVSGPKNPVAGNPLAS